jgi:hypothetical protein
VGIKGLFSASGGHRAENKPFSIYGGATMDRAAALRDATQRLEDGLFARHPDIALEVARGQLTQAVRRHDWLLAETALDILGWFTSQEGKDNDNDGRRGSGIR